VGLQAADCAKDGGAGQEIQLQLRLILRYAEV